MTDSYCSDSLEYDNDISVERITNETEPVILSNEPIVNIHIELNVEITFRRSHGLEDLHLSDDYVYLHESGFNIEVKPMTLIPLVKQYFV